MHSQRCATLSLVRPELILFALVACGGCDVYFTAFPPMSTPARGHVLASSDFSSGIDGWSMPERANGDQFGWTPNKGRSGTPGLLWEHWSAGTVRYFAAGPEFLGDRLAALDGALRFDLFGDRLTPDASRPLVILQGMDGLQIGAGFDPVSRGWQSHAISLNESGKWMNLSEQRLATIAEIAHVLTNLTDLRIRAVSTPAVLDNVELIGP